MKSMLKKEHEIAHGIVASGRWISRDSRYTEHELEMMITEALNAFADAKLEEAARRAETHHFRAHLNTKPRECVCENQIADQIRALKHSAQTKGK